jgi:hypothetical protein
VPWNLNSFRRGHLNRLLAAVSENRFSVTHEFLAMLLGSGRLSVSVVTKTSRRVEC